MSTGVDVVIGGLPMLTPNQVRLLNKQLRSKKVEKIGLKKIIQKRTIRELSALTRDLNLGPVSTTLEEMINYCQVLGSFKL